MGKHKPGFQRWLHLKLKEFERRVQEGERAEDLIEHYVRECPWQERQDYVREELSEALGLPQPFFQRYKLLEKIGEGGMGQVFKAFDSALGRHVALKKIKEGMLLSSLVIKRFLREAQILASLGDSGIVTVYDLGQHEAQLYYTMQLIEGGDLKELMKKHPPVRQKTAAGLVEKIARSVACAHEQGVIHRDLTPGNVLIDKDGNTFVTDFGLAKLLHSNEQLTKTGEAVGTLPYMAPEQRSAKDVKRTADVYSLGAILYELLTGHPPFEAEATEAKVLKKDPRRPRSVNPAVEKDLQTICLKCLEKSPKHRYQSAGELADDLGCYIRGEAIAARPVGLAVRAMRWWWRQPSSVRVSVCLSAALLVGALVWGEWAGRHTEAAQRLARARQVALQSEQALQEYPVRSLLLAIEAVETTTRQGDRAAAEAEQALRKALAQVDGYGLIGTPVGMIGPHSLLTAKNENGRGVLRSLNVETGQVTAVSIDTDVIDHVAVSADGTRLVTVGQDTACRIWKLRKKGKRITATLSVAEDRGMKRVSDLAFSSDGKWLAVYGIVSTKKEDELEVVADLWNVTSMRAHAHRLTLGRYGGWVPQSILKTPLHKPMREGVFSQDGRWLVTFHGRYYQDYIQHCSRAGTIWSLARDKPANWNDLERSTEYYVNRVAFSGDGQWLALGTRRNETHVWNLTAPPSTPAVLSGLPVGFSGDRRWIVTGAGLWELESVKRGHPQCVELYEEREEGSRVIDIEHASIDQNGRLMVAFGWGLGKQDEEEGGTVWLWDLSAQEPWNKRIGWAVEGQELTGRPLRISPDGRWIVTVDNKSIYAWGSVDELLRYDALWDMRRTNRIRSRTLRGHDNQIWELKFLSESYLLSGRSRVWMSPWDVAPASVISPDRSVLVRIGEDRNETENRRLRLDVQRFNREPGNSQLIITDNGPYLHSLGMNTDGSWLMATDYDDDHKSRLLLCDLRDTDELSKRHTIVVGRPIHKAMMDVSGTWVLTKSQKPAVQLWKLQPGAPVSHDSIVLPCLHDGWLSPDGRWVVGVGGSDETVTAWRTSELTSRSGPSQGVVLVRNVWPPEDVRVGFSRDGGRLAVAWEGDEWNQRVAVWDLGAISDSREFVVEEVEHDKEALVTALVFSADGKLLATGHRSGTIQICDLESGAGYVLPGLEDSVDHIEFSPDGRYLLANSWGRKSAYLWEASTGRRVELPANAYGYSAKYHFSADGSWLVYGGELWELDIEELVARGHRVAGRALTTEELRNSAGR